MKKNGNGVDEQDERIMALPPLRELNTKKPEQKACDICGHFTTDLLDSHYREYRELEPDPDTQGFGGGDGHLRKWRSGGYAYDYSKARLVPNKNHVICEKVRKLGDLTHDRLGMPHDLAGLSHRVFHLDGRVAQAIARIDALEAPIEEEPVPLLRRLRWKAGELAHRFGSFLQNEEEDNEL